MNLEAGCHEISNATKEREESGGFGSVEYISIADYPFQAR
jgi:hypothetical protein